MKKLLKAFVQPKSNFSYVLYFPQSKQIEPYINNVEQFFFVNNSFCDNVIYLIGLTFTYRLELWFYKSHAKNKLFENMFKKPIL